mmetsp:Transcript_1285/g.2899  ORF Transcript_1285/g.2899 Transcript_1285/m.2899 type:complete len:246 (-) Transcript_1285:1350-2087(-)
MMTLSIDVVIIVGLLVIVGPSRSNVWPRSTYTCVVIIQIAKVGIAWMVILMTVMTTTIVIGSAKIQLRIGPCIILIVRKRMVVLMLIVLIIMSVHVRWYQKMIWRMHLAVRVVGIVATTAVGIPVWNRFVLRHVQPRHFLSVKDLQVVKTFGTCPTATKQIQTASQSGQGHPRSRMWQDSTNLGTGPVACLRVENVYVVQSICSVPSTKDKYLSSFFQDATRMICPSLGAFSCGSYLAPGHGGYM